MTIRIMLKNLRNSHPGGIFRASCIKGGIDYMPTEQFNQGELDNGYIAWPNRYSKRLNRGGWCFLGSVAECEKYVYL